MLFSIVLVCVVKMHNAFLHAIQLIYLYISTNGGIFKKDPYTCQQMLEQLSMHYSAQS